MKKQIVLISAILALASFNAFAAKKDNKAAVAEASPSKSYSSSGPTEFGLGVSTMDSQGTGLGHTVSALIELNDKAAIQALFGIHGTGTFAFTLGGLYKHTVAGNRNTGLHVGGGLVLGTVGGVANIANIAALAGGGGGSQFAISILPAGGLHFTFPGLDKIVISFDAGLSVNIVGGSADFKIGPYSTLGGLSVHYML